MNIFVVIVRYLVCILYNVFINCSLKGTIEETFTKGRIKSMRTLLIYIAFLNLLDASLTMYGLHYEYITESNPLMNTLYLTKPWLFLLQKVHLSILLLIILYYLNTNKKTSKTLLGVAGVAAVSYTFTCLLHGYWIVALI